MSVAPVPTQLLPVRAELEIGADRGPQLGDQLGADESEGAVDFDDVLAATVSHAAHLGNVSEAQAADFARGYVDDLHGTMISVKKAEISLRLVGSIRNKLLDAFHEVWRISV